MIIPPTAGPVPPFTGVPVIPDRQHRRPGRTPSYSPPVIPPYPEDPRRRPVVPPVPYPGRPHRPGTPFVVQPPQEEEDYVIPPSPRSSRSSSSRTASPRPIPGPGPPVIVAPPAQGPPTFIPMPPTMVPMSPSRRSSTGSYPSYAESDVGRPPSRPSAPHVVPQSNIGAVSAPAPQTQPGQPTTMIVSGPGPSAQQVSGPIPGQPGLQPTIVIRPPSIHFTPSGHPVTDVRPGHSIAPSDRSPSRISGRHPSALEDYPDRSRRRRPSHHSPRSRSSSPRDHRPPQTLLVQSSSRSPRRRTPPPVVIQQPPTQFPGQFGQPMGAFPPGMMPPGMVGYPQPMQPTFIQVPPSGMQQQPTHIIMPSSSRSSSRSSRRRSRRRRSRSRSPRYSRDQPAHVVQISTQPSVRDEDPGSRRRSSPRERNRLVRRHDPGRRTPPQGPVAAPPVTIVSGDPHRRPRSRAGFWDWLMSPRDRRLRDRAVRSGRYRSPSYSPRRPYRLRPRRSRSSSEFDRGPPRYRPPHRRARSESSERTRPPIVVHAPSDRSSPHVHPGRDTIRPTVIPGRQYASQEPTLVMLPSRRPSARHPSAHRLSEYPADRPSSRHEPRIQRISSPSPSSRSRSPPPHLVPQHHDYAQVSRPPTLLPFERQPEDTRPIRLRSSPRPQEEGM